MSKALLKGQERTMICQMVKVVNILGRSEVIDLQAPLDNNQCWIGHRRVIYIIFKNKKYELKKGGKNFADIDTAIPKGDELWKASKLSVGNIFSGTSYYETVADVGSHVFCHEKNQNDQRVRIEKSILEREMHNACVWDSEETITKTQLAEKLTQANNMVI